MPQKLIIALNGFKGSGKDLGADYLIKNYGFIRVAFADALKTMVSEIYDIPREWCDSSTFKETPIITIPAEPKDAFATMICQYLFKELRDEAGNVPVFFSSCDNKFTYKTGLNFEDRKTYFTSRALCILEGSLKRTINSNYWVSKTIDTIKASSGDAFIITDLRYRSEISELKEAFQLLERILFTKVQRFDNIESTDASERDLEGYDFDYILYNKGDKTSYFKHLDWFIQHLTGEDT